MRTVYNSVCSNERRGECTTLSVIMNQSRRQCIKFSTVMDQKDGKQQYL